MCQGMSPRLTDLRLVPRPERGALPTTRDHARLNQATPQRLSRGKTFAGPNRSGGVQSVPPKSRGSPIESLYGYRALFRLAAFMPIAV